MWIHERLVPEVPRFGELPVRVGAPPGSSWGVFGDTDEIGTLNFIGVAQVRKAVTLVRRGKVFSLNWDLGLPSPAFFMRKNFTHRILERSGGVVLDEYVDGFWPQVSSHWDGLRHFADADYGFYNGAQLSEVTRPGAGRLGIEKWARQGIAGRGVLLDVARALEERGAAPNPFDFFPVDCDLLEHVAERQGVAFEPGDVLVLRTGWVEAYEQLDLAEREGLAAMGPPGSPGLYGEDIPAFLWDLRIAAVAADNPGVEAVYAGKGSDLSLHRSLIAGLGMPLGELWDVTALAADCAEDGIYDFLVTSAPLNLGGGAGSPSNALAIK